MIPLIVIIVCLVAYGYFCLFQTERMIKLEMDYTDQYRESFKALFFWHQRFPKIWIARYRIGGVMALSMAALLTSIFVYTQIFHGGLRVGDSGGLNFYQQREHK